MVRKNNANIGPRDRQAVGGLMVLLGSAWLYAAMRLGLPASTLGPICGHSGAFALHCPACYVAGAMIIAGFALGLSATRVAGPNLAYAGRRQPAHRKA
jgi:hypothetical protein